MNKIKTMLVAVVAITFISTYAFAGSIGFGVTGSLAAIGAVGSETEGTVTDTSPTDASAHNNAYIGSLFAEYTMDGDHGMTFGVDWIPGAADVNDKTVSRTDTELSQTSEEKETTASVTRTAQATIDSHMTYYAELPVHAGTYVKLGWTQMDVNTKESFAGTKGYGNTSVDGVMYGVGYKVASDSNWYYKLEGTHTDYDSFTLNEVNQSTGSAQSSITADLDVTKATFALGYKF